jgi:uncharacterized membrane protein (UPF0182 family)
MRTRRPSLLRIPRARSLLLAGALAIVATTATLAAHAYTDLLVFTELGGEDVFWTTLRWKLLAYGAAGAGTAAIVLANLLVAERLSHGAAARVTREQRRLAYPIVAIAAGIISAQWHAPGTWSRLALWSGRTDFGVTDPLFHRDAGFYVFSLPLYQHVAAWLLASLAMAAAASVAVHAVASGIRRDGRLLVSRGARAHLLLLAAIVLLVVSWRYRLDRYSLAVPHGGLTGAGFTDAHVRAPARAILAWLAVIAAGIVAGAAAGRLRPLPTAITIVIALLAITAPGLISRPLERYVVQPQKLTRERPYVSASIAATRRAFALDRIAARASPGSGRVSAVDLEQGRATVDNVPLWDADVLRPALDELQSLARYYSFASTTLDRYRLNGVPQTLTVAARQLDLRGLGPDARGWANPRLAYTHGYGVTAVRSTQTGDSGHPRFAQTGFGADANPLGLREPRVYFGEQPATRPRYVVVASRRAEVDAPVPGSETPGYHYDGPGGIGLSGLVRRSAFALRFGDLNLLLSQTIGKRSRILVHRDAGERLRTLAPFLRWDGRPQTVIAGGRVNFVFSGYTTSRSYPYSQPVELGGARVNYARAAVHAVVDGFDGSVRIFAADAGDPILRAWRTVYPGLVRPAAEMPAELRSHLRYPVALFDAQIEAYATYHAAEPTAFANGSDTWERALQLAGPVEKVGEIRFPTAVARDRTRPATVFARLPGEAEEHFMLAMPFTPRGRENLVAYLAASLDEQGHPRLTLLSLPRNRLTLGPSQVTRRILASPGVSRRLELSNREARDLGKTSVDRTIVGEPRLLPIGDTLVQVQPIYLVAGGSGVPRLQLVTALANDRVGYGPDVETALRRTLPAGTGMAAATSAPPSAGLATSSRPSTAASRSQMP